MIRRSPDRVFELQTSPRALRKGVLQKAFTTVEHAHREAAKHHEAAARAHHAAAEHHAKGDAASGRKHLEEAHARTTKAHESSKDAHGKSAAKK